MSSRHRITIDLTPAEARGIIAILGEGYEGLATNPSAARGYIGPPSAQRAAWRGADALLAELRKITTGGDAL